MKYFITYLPLLSSIFIFISGFFVFFKNKKSLLNLIFLMFCLSFTIWLFGTFMMFKSFFEESDTNAIFWDRIVYIGVVFMPALIHHLSIAFTRTIKQKKLILSGYAISVIFLVLSRTDYFVKDLYKYKWGCHTIAQPIHHIFLLWFWGYVFLSLTNLYQYYKKGEGNIEKNRTKYFLLAILLLFSIGGLGYLPAYKIPIYPFPFFSGVIFTTILAYAILKYRLMDITIAITRTTIFVAVYTLVLGLPFTLAFWLKTWFIAIFGTNWWILPLILMAVLATTGPFVFIFLERRAEDALLKEQRRYQKILKQASVGITRIRDLSKLLKLIARIITKTVKITHSAIYLYDRNTGNYDLEVSSQKTNKPLAQRIGSDNLLISWFWLNRQVLVHEEIKRKLQDSGLNEYMELEKSLRSLEAAVIVPSFLEGKFVGFIVFGDKISGKIYSPEDLEVFEVLAAQAALAIENAQFYQEAKEMQEQISQAEKMATIGTMADGMSHQINNRFYALALIASDTIDTIKTTDTSKCSPEIQTMVNQISHALERIQANVLQGGDVVRGMLKYTRRGEEGFEPLDLNTVLDNTLEMIQFKVKLSEIDFVRSFSNMPKIKGNLTQLEEVFFNFIDNAYEAILERGIMLKEKDYRGKIIISAKPKTEETLEILIEDNGIGVKEEDKRKVFTPFFTTKSSSRKGTGLGLYVIKRIITEMHNGKIVFESQYKMGARFILELPLAK